MAPLAPSNPCLRLWYNEPGRVGSPVVQVVVVWILSIVLSSRLIETTLFYEKTFYVG